MFVDGGKAEPFSLTGWIAWLETQPADKAYNFLSTDCGICQYFEACGYQVDHVGFTYITLANGETRAMPRHFNAIAEARPHTFGAALARARLAAC